MVLQFCHDRGGIYDISKLFKTLYMQFHGPRLPRGGLGPLPSLGSNQGFFLLEGGILCHCRLRLARWGSGQLNVKYFVTMTAVKISI